MMAANDRSERCWSEAPEYENPRVRMIVADGTPKYLETIRSVLDFHDIADLLGRAVNFEETIQLVKIHPDQRRWRVCEKPSRFLRAFFRNPPPQARKT